MPKSYYIILGIPASSTQEDIKSAYKRLAKEYHPDRYNQGHSPFQNIQEAYSVLSDPSQRQPDLRMAFTALELENRLVGLVIFEIAEIGL